MCIENILTFLREQELKNRKWLTNVFNHIDTGAFSTKFRNSVKDLFVFRVLYLSQSKVKTNSDYKVHL